MPRNRVYPQNFDVLSADEMNPNFKYKKPVSAENVHNPVFAVRFDFDDTGYVAYMSDCSDNKKGKDCHTALYTEADYLLEDIPKPVWEKIEQNGETIINGKMPKGIEASFQEAILMGNDTVYEILGKHTKSYENIDMKIKYGIEDGFPNQLPSFSVTCAGYNSYGRCVIGGADHNNILKLHPKLKNLCHMHGRNILGEPLYAVENGWYYVSDEKLHNGFNEGNRRSTVAKYLDIPQEMANHIVDSYQAGKLTKEGFAAIVETQRPIWKRQAEAVIQEYDLEVRKDRPKTREELEEVRNKVKLRAKSKSNANKNNLGMEM